MAINLNKKKRDIFATPLENKKQRSFIKPQNFVVSFEDFDATQKSGSSFRDWQNVGLLSTMLDVLKGYCCSPLLDNVDGKKFTIYGDFPPSGKTKFKYPRHVAEDASWARIHVNNITIIAGHVVNNTFYVVFLDKYHHFYISEKKNT